MSTNNGFMTTKLFISYRSSDSANVDMIIRRLRSLRNEDGTPHYHVWQDKDSIPEGQDWWDSIVDAIIDCDVFVFMISNDSVQNINCRAELSFARKLNRPILPFILEGEFVFNPISGKNDITFWEIIPDELKDIRAQFLFYEGTNFIQRVDRAVKHFLSEPERWRLIPADRPPDPRNANDESNSADALYDEAYDFAWRGEFDTAARKFQILVNRKASEFSAMSYEWIIILRDYSKLVRYAARTSTRFMVEGMWTDYQSHFPKRFIEGVFDPKGIGSQFTDEVNREEVRSEISKSSRLWHTEYPDLEDAERMDRVVEQSAQFMETRASTPVAPSRPRSIDFMPQPFDWIEIPGKGYSIAKYPVTNAQFRKFIDAKGYENKDWWTTQGWRVCKKKGWTEPRFWNNSDFNDDKQPVVGVCWYEAVAFCLWLSDVTSENIMLPTEDQWQYAAQGDDGRDYPWGKNWDCKRCSNSVDPCSCNSTTPVTQYEGKGDSPFDVVDMAGNVWEWCLTDAINTTNDVNSNANRRVVRGGSWNDDRANDFRCDISDGDSPRGWVSNVGFRLSRS